MTFSRLTSKGQVTVPKAVRDKLHLKPGDTLAYEVEGAEARIRKVTSFDASWHRAVSGNFGGVEQS